MPIQYTGLESEIKVIYILYTFPNTVEYCKYGEVADLLRYSQSQFENNSRDTVPLIVM